MELPERKDVPVRETWDLSLLFRTEEEYTDAVEKVKRLAESIVTEFKGKLDGPDTMIACLEQYEQFCILLQHTSAYAELSLSVDYTDTLRQDRNAQMTALRAELQNRLSFIESEITRR